MSRADEGPRPAVQAGTSPGSDPIAQRVGASPWSGSSLGGLFRRRKSPGHWLFGPRQACRPPACSNGLEPRARCWVETCRYRVVLRNRAGAPAAPGSSADLSPDSSRWVAKLWRNAWGGSRRSMPSAAAAQWTARRTVSGHSGLLQNLPGEQQRSWWTRQSPVLTQGLEQSPGQHITSQGHPPFTPADVDNPRLAVDVPGLQRQRLGDAQAK